MGGLVDATRRALGRSARIGGGPTRFCALAAARQARPRKARLVKDREARAYLAAQPMSILANRTDTAALVAPLEQLGISTLGEFVALGASAVSDRFGNAGLLARRLALGQDDPLRPRRPEERLTVSQRVGDTNSLLALERTLEVLVDRLLAARSRRGRAIRALRLWARLVERGTWREQVVLREPTAEAVRLRLATAPRLGSLPAPTEELGLTVGAWGPADGDQQSLLDSTGEARLARLRSAIEQTRAQAGAYAVLRALEVDPTSRVPERRFTYTPFTE